jgi:hypothetical protein
MFEARDQIFGLRHSQPQVTSELVGGNADLFREQPQSRELQFANASGGERA